MIALNAFKEEVRMAEILDYLLCDSCANKDFKIIYNFCLRFHGVNFSDDLIYDEVTEKIYQCTKCHKTFKKKYIEDGLAKLKKKGKGS